MTQQLLMEEIRISKVTASDINELHTISKRTFLDTFAQHNSEKNMAHYLTESLSLEKLASEVANENSDFYFATANDEVIGYLKVNYGPSQTELQDSQALEIERIYVSQQYQGKKVGQLLFDLAIDLAEKRNALYVWLGVWEQNAKAIRFYEKNGFVPFSSHVFKLGEDVQTDIMMKKEL
ncbi:GNAT family N-acetyltransferase [Terrimonas sp. NA20]|uniref:GNAT family N-acetyltransferase n=1 Tax=Terrimonas ginsenosidimutans TaxID=2908004 RepID=A0ABS9KLX8_9BACT|nr:GNAT family N-acetyltransferase [Terrimonas ginsenosidimutans]MCG2613319.1 GNAT family N-acetyltransferase [Terrimonas ginsenosidimutans]